MADRGEVGESYLSHFCFDDAMARHYQANGRSVAGFAGPCWARWLVFDIDAVDLSDALAGARKLFSFLAERYDVQPITYFSGSKGFHVVIDLGGGIAPADGFHRIAGTLALGVAAAAGVKIDGAVYDLARILRLPNTRHPKTGLFKRVLDAEELFSLTVDGIRKLAENPRGEPLPPIGPTPSQLLTDWKAAELRAGETATSRAVARVERSGEPDGRAPKFLVDFLRFGVDQGERHQVLFRCAAWLVEQGAPLRSHMPF